MNRLPTVVLLGFLASALAGCGSPQMSRIDRNRSVYESWPLEMQQAVLDGKVVPGMTPEMVKVAWGKPTDVEGDASIGDEVWIYRTGGSDGTMMYPGSSYPGSAYPGAVYPGGAYPGVYPSGNSVGISTGSGGTGLVGNTGVGVGIGSSGLGVSGPGVIMGNPGISGVGGATPVYIPPTPEEVREVVFRNGEVLRADQPLR